MWWGSFPYRSSSPSSSASDPAPHECTLGGSRWWLKFLGPCPRVRVRVWETRWNSWLQPGPFLAVADIWGVNQGLEDWSSLSFQVVEKSLKKKNLFFSQVDLCLRDRVWSCMGRTTHSVRGNWVWICVQKAWDWKDFVCVVMNLLQGSRAQAEEQYWWLGNV